MLRQCIQIDILDPLEAGSKIILRTNAMTLLTHLQLLIRKVEEDSCGPKPLNRTSPTKSRP